MTKKNEMYDKEIEFLRGEISRMYVMTDESDITKMGIDALAAHDKMVSERNKTEITSKQKAKEKAKTAAYRKSPEFLENKDYPLDERWKAFCKTDNCQNYILHIKTSFCKDIIAERWNDDSGEFRNRTFSVIEMVEEWESEHDPLMGYKKSEITWTLEQLNEIKEAVIKAGYTEFVWDW
jgi:hypothetical protein